MLFKCQRIPCVIIVYFLDFVPRHTDALNRNKVPLHYAGAVLKTGGPTALINTRRSLILPQRRQRRLQKMPLSKTSYCLAFYGANPPQHLEKGRRRGAPPLMLHPPRRWRGRFLDFLPGFPTPLVEVGGPSAPRAVTFCTLTSISSALS